MIKIFHNWHLKLLAVLTAIILWFIVIAVENTVYKLPQQISVNIVNLDENLSLDKKLPQVSLYLRTDQDSLRTLTEKDFEAFVDLEDYEAGQFEVPIEVTAKNISAGSILKIEPESAVLKISPVTEKEIEVKINVEGQPAPGYAFVRLEPENAVATIGGAQTIIDELEFVEANLLLDGTETTSIRQNISLTLPEGSESVSDLVVLDPKQVSVTAIIETESNEIELSIFPTFANSEDADIWRERIIIEPPTIKVDGSLSILENLEGVRTEAFEVDNLESGQEIFISLILPEGVTSPTREVRITPAASDTDNE